MDGMGQALDALVWGTLALGAIFTCGGAIIVGGVVACVLATTLYACGCLVCPQHDNKDIPMDEIQADFETAGNDSDLAEAI